MKSKQTTHANDTSGIIALLCVAFVYAVFGIFARYLDGNFTIYQQMYMRLGLAIILSLIVFRKHLRFNYYLTLPKKEWLVISSRALFLYGIAASLYIQSLLLTTYSNASFLTAIPTIAVLGVLFLQERLTLPKAGIILLAFTGVVFISIQDTSNLLSWGRGEVAALISDVFFSLGFISRRWHGSYLNNREITFLLLIISFVLVFILSLIFDRSLPVTGWTPLYGGALLIGAAMTVVSQTLMNYGFQHVKPFLANNILALESIYSLLIGLFIYAEIPLARELIGSLLIILSVPMMNMIEEKEKKLDKT